MRCQWVCSHLWQWSPLQANQPALTSPEQIKKLLIVKPQIRNIAKDTYQKTHAKQNVILPPQFPCLPFLTWLFNNCTIKNGVCVKRKTVAQAKKRLRRNLYLAMRNFSRIVFLTNVAVTGRKLDLMIHQIYQPLLHLSFLFQKLFSSLSS